MWFSVDDHAVDSAGAFGAGAAELLAGIDLGGLAEAVGTAMPGSRSTGVAADGLTVLSREVCAVAARLADHSSRLRLAAAQYATADTVARAGARAGGSDASPTAPPVVTELNR